MGTVVGRTQRVQLGSFEAQDKMYRLCNKKQYFTCGSHAQYDKFFQMVRERKSLDSIARVLWVCSNEKFTFEEIYKDCYDNLMVVREV